MIDILCVGTGRDGTVTMTDLINQIFTYENKNRTCAHEIFSRMIYNRLHEIGYDDLCTDKKIVDLISQCEFSSIVGAGYSVALGHFAKIYPQCKLIHLKRRDKHAFIESFLKMVSQLPNLVGGYSDIDEACIDSYIMTACDFKEMSGVEWNLLSTLEKVSWYYEKTHLLIEDCKHLFADYKIINTENLNEEKTRRELTKYVLGDSRSDFIPNLTHLNSHFFQNFRCSPHEKSLLHWWFHNLNPHDILNDDSYLIDFIANKYTALLGYHDDSKIEELFGLDSKPKDKIINNLEKAIAVLHAHTALLEKVKTRIDLEKRESGNTEIQQFYKDNIFGIKIIEATYGWNCREQAGVGVQPGNVTSKIREKCDGKEGVKFKVDVNELGDPAPGLEKDLSITWRYAEDPKMMLHHLYISAEAHGKLAEIPNLNSVNESNKSE